MRQVFALHGGNTFAAYDAYLADLRATEVDLERSKPRVDWKHELGVALGDGYDAYTPRFPNAQNAQYPEWKIMFEKFAALMQPGVILIGHSLGGMFLAKYLAEETFALKPAVFLVAAPFDEGNDHNLAQFIPPASLGRFEEQASAVYLYHSTDDPVVLIDELAKYRERLSSAIVRTFADRQHFNQDSFPEIVEDIRALGLTS